MQRLNSVYRYATKKNAISNRIMQLMQLACNQYAELKKALQSKKKIILINNCFFIFCREGYPPKFQGHFAVFQYAAFGTR